MPKKLTMRVEVKCGDSWYGCAISWRLRMSLLPTNIMNVLKGGRWTRVKNMRMAEPDDDDLRGIPITSLLRRGR
jgi:hypothetical protein